MHKDSATDQALTNSPAFQDQWVSTLETTAIKYLLICFYLKLIRAKIIKKRARDQLVHVPTAFPSST